MDKQKIQFGAFGGVGNATGANFLIKSDINFLVDCGLVQGSEFAVNENNESFGYDPREVDFLLVTHAHMDHIGRIPKLVKDGFRGKIHSTKATKELARVMLDDAHNILLRESKELGRTPLYESEDIDRAMSLWETHDYHSPFNFSENTRINFKDAGHILGSSIIEVTTNGKKFAFTGDLGNSPSPLLPDNEVVTDADYMVIESVYGDRNHEPKDLRDRKLETLLKSVTGRGGTVVIPAFSVERTQIILYAINELVESGKLPKVPVFLDSPLAIKTTEIYKQSRDLFKKSVKEDIVSGDNIFDFPGLKIVENNNESHGIHGQKGPKIIIAGSGMSVGGRVISHERHYLGDPNSMILFVGYQTPGSLGRRIEEGVKKVQIEGENVVVRARIESIKGYSSHMDSDHLVEFVSHGASKLKKVFVAMGEYKSSTFLAQRLRDELGVIAEIPDKGVFYEL